MDMLRRDVHTMSRSRAQVYWRVAHGVGASTVVPR